MSINQQQIPKDQGYMECWIARPGMVWVDFDVASLEPVVLTELSQDKTMMKLYGPGAKEGQDIYLFNAYHIPKLADNVRKYYNPDNPTPETTEIAKKQCKKERSISKLITLGSSYGAGPAKIQQSLELEGINLSFDEAKAIHTAYWDLYKGVKTYQAKLLAEWEGHGGWIYNGLGRPLTVAPDVVKDLVNRCVAKGTLIRVKDFGYIPIEKVCKGMQVWDGIKWVNTDGAIYNGIKETIKVNDVFMTKDHKILTINLTMEECRNVQKSRIYVINKKTSPNVSWKDIWRLGNYIIIHVAQKICNLCRSSM